MYKLLLAVYTVMEAIMKKRFLAIVLMSLYFIQSILLSYAVSDRDILSDPVANIYTGSTLGKAIITNVSFADVSMSHWAKEPITRLGALSVVKGYNAGNAHAFRPDQIVSKEEALAFLLRVIGQEATALQAAEALVAADDDALLTIWSRGYLQVAANLGLINQAELGEGLLINQAALDPEFNFIRTEATTREEVAKWLVETIRIVNQDSIAPLYEQQEIFTLSDWETIGNDYVPYVEAVMQAGIMVGDGLEFKPKGSLKRSEMAQIISNIDDILYRTMDLELKGGIVGSITDSADIGMLSSETKRTVLIRNDEGLVDRVDLVYTSDDTNKVTSLLDVPVLGDGGVEGLASLKEGDYIEYIVDFTTKEMKYIYNKGIEPETLVKGILQPLNEVEEGNITIENESGMAFTYKMVEGLYDEENQTLKIGYIAYPISNAPVANTVVLTIKNNLVTLIDYDGAMALTTEISGIVKEVDTVFSFITIEDWSGHEVTKYFNKEAVVVEKNNYYDVEDEIGYIDEVFPDYRFDERDTTIDAIEVGDIVHILLDSLNPEYIVRISARTNYNVKFGEVIEIADYGANGLKIRVAYDNSSVGTLDVDRGVPVMLSSVNVGIKGLEVGHMIKVLLNQAVIEPGTIKETIKHIDIDPYGNVLSKIYKGELGYIDQVKETVSLLNSYELNKAGWGDYSQLKKLEIPDKGVEAYYNGKQISLSYANEYLRTYNMLMYVVTEEYYNREQIAKVVFEDGVGEVLANSNITYSNGYDIIQMVSSADNIAVNQGTIVIKNNHIVSTGSILSPDYAQVVLGEADSAVVVNIMPEPNNDAISVFRGRIDSIETGELVKVESHAVLKDMIWVYSPIKRQFTLSYDTIIVNEDGMIALDDFIDYSEISKVDEVYTIIAEGTKATHLIKNPYATEGVVGEIYEVGDTIIDIKDALVYDGDTKLWKELSIRNNYAQINTSIETVVIKNNKVITIDELEIGDQIRVMITVDLSEQLKLEGKRAVDGYIIFVEE